MLEQKGGSGHVQDVVDEVGKLAAKQLTDVDRAVNQSGIVRWRNRVMWRRFQLVQFGLLKEDSPRGIWEITDSGKNALAARKIDYAS